MQQYNGTNLEADVANRRKTRTESLNDLNLFINYFEQEFETRKSFENNCNRIKCYNNEQKKTQEKTIGSKKIINVKKNQQLKVFNKFNINDKYRNPDNVPYKLQSDNYNVVNTMNLQHLQQQRKQEQNIKYIKRKSNNFFKHKQSQNSIYLRACCFFTLLHAKIHQQTSSSSTSTTEKSIKTTKHNNRRSSTACIYSNLNLLPKLGASSFLTLFILLCLELVLLSTVTNCAKTFYMHWNTSNSIFRIDNTDHIIDVNKGNLAFEFDQVHIICPVYEPGTYENETEKYIIYNVSKVEYETCRITNADPRVIAICDKPQKLMFFTITFRPFTPQPGGLEFLPGNDYYFISTSSKDDLYRRIGGRCSTNNMKVVFKVCCVPEENKTTTTTTTTLSNSSNNSGSGNVHMNNVGETNDANRQEGMNNHHRTHQHHIQHNSNVNTALTPNVLGGISSTSTNIAAGKIKTNIDQFNRIPIQTNAATINGNSVNIIGDMNVGTQQLGNGILLSPGHSGINMISNNNMANGGLGPYGHPGLSGGLRINNVPMQKNNDDHRFDKHPNEVVKNEELTYNSASTSTVCGQPFWIDLFYFILMQFIEMYIILTGNWIYFLIIVLGYCGQYYFTIDIYKRVMNYFNHKLKKIPNNVYNNQTDIGC